MSVLSHSCLVLDNRPAQTAHHVCLKLSHLKIIYETQRFPKSKSTKGKQDVTQSSAEAYSHLVIGISDNKHNPKIFPGDRWALSPTLGYVVRTVALFAVEIPPPFFDKVCDDSLFRKVAGHPVGLRDQKESAI